MSVYNRPLFRQMGGPAQPMPQDMAPPAQQLPHGPRLVAVKALALLPERQGVKRVAGLLGLPQIGSDLQSSGQRLKVQGVLPLSQALPE